MATVDDLLQMEAWQLAALIELELIGSMPRHGSRPVPMRGEPNTGPRLEPRPPTIRPEGSGEQIARITSFIERLGDSACNVYCEYKARPIQEVVQEMAKVFLAAISIETGLETDAFRIALGTACAVFFLKTGMDKACAC